MTTMTKKSKNNSSDRTYSYFIKTVPKDLPLIKPRNSDGSLMDLSKPIEITHLSEAITRWFSEIKDEIFELESNGQQSKLLDLGDMLAHIKGPHWVALNDIFNQKQLNKMTLEFYLKNGYILLKHQGSYLFLDDPLSAVETPSFWISPQQSVYYVADNDGVIDDIKCHINDVNANLDDILPCGIIYTDPKTKKRRFFGNADVGAFVNDEPEVSPQQLHSFSFYCLARLVLGLYNDDEPEPEDLKSVLKQIASGDIKIVDSKPDKHLLNPATLTGLDQDSDEFKSKLDQYRNKGWTRIISRSDHMSQILLHRPATVLFYHKKNYYLLGQDEGTYFGVQLSEPVKTVQAATRSLMPESARNTTGWIRQGEWFLVPTDDPADLGVNKTNCLLFRESVELPPLAFMLPVDDPESHLHWVTAGEYIVSQKGTIYVRDVYLEHDEHSTIEGKPDQWYTIEKNTALVSVSQEGVD